MKKTMVSILTGFAFLFNIVWMPSVALPVYQNKDRVTTGNKEQKKQETVKKVDKQVYTCPMHAGVSSEKPGKCPECKMNLVKKEVKKTSFTCPMHAEVSSDTQGKCPKCKMKLVEKKQKDNKATLAM